MIKKTITYADFNGDSHTEDFYFNLSKLELNDMNLRTEGGVDTKINNIMTNQDIAGFFEFLKELTVLAYGQKSQDGKRFIKSATATEEFTQTEAYAELIFELASDSDAASAFILGMMPQGLQEQVTLEMKKRNMAVAALPNA